MLALGVVSVSDQLHAQLHAAPGECGHVHHSAPDDAEHDATCVVELFAAGISVPVDPTHVLVAPLAVVEQAFQLENAAEFAAPSHRQPPGRGPPAV